MIKKSQLRADWWGDSAGIGMGRRIKGKSRETIFIKLISSKDRLFCVNVSVRGDKRVMGIEVYGKFMTLT